jgi:hypothetical protein
MTFKMSFLKYSKKKNKSQITENKKLCTAKCFFFTLFLKKPSKYAVYHLEPKFQALQKIAEGELFE